MTTANVFCGWKHAPVLSPSMSWVSHLKYMVPSQSDFTQVQAKMHSAKPGNPALQSKQTVWVIVHLHNFFEIQWRTPYINYRGLENILISEACHVVSATNPWALHVCSQESPHLCHDITGFPQHLGKCHLLFFLPLLYFLAPLNDIK